jgi:hypothetical protein
MCLALIVFWFARSLFAAENVAPLVEIEDGEILYDGRIEKESVQKFIALFAQMPVKPTTFTIRSMGGDGDAGLDLGEFVHAHGLSVRVWDYCHSSCANFVFIAARNKVVPQGAIVAWHGSPLQQNWKIPGREQSHRCTSPETCAAEVARATAEARQCRTTETCSEERANLERSVFAMIDSQSRRMQALYVATGVDPRVTTYGIDVACSCDWTFSIEDMRKFNITDLVEEKSRKLGDFSWRGRKQALNLRAQLTTFKLP